MNVSSRPILPIKPDLHFGANIVEDGAGGRSKYYKPLMTWKQSNGDTIEFFNVSIHDRGRRECNPNVKIIPTSDKTKMVIGSLLLVSALGLGMASVVFPPLALAAFCCGVTSIALFMSKGLVG